MTQQTQERTQTTVFQIPRISEYADAITQIMRELKNIGASPGEIISLLKPDNKPLDSNSDNETSLELEVDIDIDILTVPAAPAKPPRKLITAQKIARTLGIYSIYGLPHAHAVSVILNHNIILDDDQYEDRVLFETNNIIVYYTLYDESVIDQVADWIEAHGMPYEIDGRYYTYYVLYR